MSEASSFDFPAFLTLNVYGTSTVFVFSFSRRRVATWNSNPLAPRQYHFLTRIRPKLYKTRGRRTRP